MIHSTVTTIARRGRQILTTSIPSWRKRDNQIHYLAKNEADANCSDVVIGITTSSIYSSAEQKKANRRFLGCAREGLSTEMSFDELKGSTSVTAAVAAATDKNEYIRRSGKWPGQCERILHLTKSHKYFREMHISRVCERKRLLI